MIELSLIEGHTSIRRSADPLGEVHGSLRRVTGYRVGSV